MSRHLVSRAPARCPALRRVAIVVCALALALATCRSLAPVVGIAPEACAYAAGAGVTEDGNTVVTISVPPVLLAALVALVVRVPAAGRRLPHRPDRRPARRRAPLLILRC